MYKFHALITTYELVLSDAEILRDIKWRLVIIDEAHRLKNQKCRLLNELKTLDLGTNVVTMGLPHVSLSVSPLAITARETISVSGLCNAVFPLSANFHKQSTVSY